MIGTEKEGMSAEVIAEGGRDRVLVCDKVKFTVFFKLMSPLVSIMMTERVGDEDLVWALRSEIEMFTGGVEHLRKFESAREEIRNQANGSR